MWCVMAVVVSVQEKTALGSARAAGSAIACHLKMACARVGAYFSPPGHTHPSSRFVNRSWYFPSDDRDVQWGAKVLVRNIILITK